MTFMPLSSCCLQGSELPGSPRGTMQLAGSDGVTLDRYYTRPADGVLKHPNTCLVLLYDVFGFGIDNPKILADRYADLLGVEVYAPDYIPNTVPQSYLDPALELYPGDKAGESWLASIWAKAKLVRMVTYLPGILDGQACPRVDQALADLKPSYEKIGAIGYCRGGSLVTYLMAKGDDGPIDAGAIFHPEFTPARWPLFTRPSRWLLAEKDTHFPPAKVKQLEDAFKDGHAQAEVTVYKDTVHGFGARPMWEHEGTVKSFQKANDDAASFLKLALGL